ncbi:MAG: hypothetical protein ABF741_11280 [Liquorilactobacillus ghanensis]
MPTVSDSVTIPDKIQIYFSTLVKVIRGFLLDELSTQVQLFTHEDF